jgi:RNA polymerase sigma-70 factor (ECF subfamily)
VITHTRFQPSGPIETEFDSVRAAQAGSRSAFRHLYDQHRDAVYNLIVYLTGNRMEAEDLLQNTFLKAYRALAGFRFEASFKTWILRIAHNECTDALRRNHPDMIPIEDLFGSQEEIDHSRLPDDLHLQSERQEVLAQVLLELSPKLRTVIILRYVESLSYEEIADILECSVGTVSSRLHRALTEMEAQLRPFKRML